MGSQMSANDWHDSACTYDVMDGKRMTPIPVFSQTSGLTIIAHNKPPDVSSKRIENTGLHAMQLIGFTINL